MFDSSDWIEDACDLLDKSAFPYILITGIDDDNTRVDSFINADPNIEEAVIDVIKMEFKRLRDKREI